MRGGGGGQEARACVYVCVCMCVVVVVRKPVCVCVWTLRQNGSRKGFWRTRLVLQTEQASGVVTSQEIEGDSKE